MIQYRRFATRLRSDSTDNDKIRIVSQKVRYSLNELLIVDQFNTPVRHVF